MTDVVLSMNSEYIMDIIWDTRIFYEDIADISVIYNEERRLREFNSHRA